MQRFDSSDKPEAIEGEYNSDFPSDDNEEYESFDSIPEEDLNDCDDFDDKEIKEETAFMNEEEFDDSDDGLIPDLIMRYNSSLDSDSDSNFDDDSDDEDEEIKE